MEDRQAQGRLLARNTVLNMLGQGLPLLVALLALPYMVKGLGEARFGVLALSWSVLGHFGVLDLGLGRAATKFVAQALGEKAFASVPRVVGTAVLVQLVFGLAGGVGLALAAGWLAGSVFNLPPELVQETTGALHVVAVVLPLVLLTSSIRGSLEAAQRFDLINLVTVPASSANYLLPVLGVALGWPLAGIIGLLAGGRLLSLVALTLLALRCVPGLAGRWRTDAAMFRQMIGFGGWVMISNLTGPLLSQLERFMIPALLTVGALTYYSVPCEMLVRLTILPGSMALTLYPAFSYLQRSDPGALDELFARPLKYLFAMMTPVMGLVGVFGEPLLSLWLGSAFAEQAIGALWLLVISFYLNAFAHIPYAAIQGLGRPDLKAKLDLFEVSLFVGLLLWFIPMWGIAGAAAAKLAVTVVDTLALFWLVSWVHPGDLAQRFPPVLRRAALLSAATIGLLVAILLLQQRLLTQIPSYVGVIAVYLVAYWKLAVDRTDREVLRQAVHRISGGRLL